MSQTARFAVRQRRQTAMSTSIRDLRLRDLELSVWKSKSAPCIKIHEGKKVLSKSAKVKIGVIS